MRDRKTRKLVMYGLMIALMVTTVAYAVLQTTLNINGTVTKKGGSWRIYFDNPVVVIKKGEATLSLPETFPTNSTTFDYDVTVVKPGDKVEFTVDVVNGGTMDANLDSVTITGVSEAQVQDITYSVKYADGTAISNGDSLAKETRKTIKIVVEYDQNATTLSPNDIELDLGLTLIYVQATSEGGFASGGLEKNPGIIEGDTSLANAPNLLNNSLTPVVYDEDYYGEGMGAWVVADTSKAWYNYSQQQWANAVVLNSGVTKNVGDPIVLPTATTNGETTSTSEVQAMYVWIPRYEYKIEGQYGTHTDGTAGTAELPGEIKVNFISQSQVAASSGYHLHPAFTWDLSDNDVIEASEHLTGIWVGKFITTGTYSNPTILPNLYLLNGLNVSDSGDSGIFTNAQKHATYLKNQVNTDSHAMKNSERGAVAYLSQSAYGKYGNSMYTGANKEIYANDAQHENTLTGITAPMSGASGGDWSSIYAECLYDDIEDRGNGTGSCGGRASTTGNIYGVYDMNVGEVPSFMGFYTELEQCNGFGSSSYGEDGCYGGFVSEPAGRYYDAYTTDNPETACNGGICYGHGLSETKGWYNAYFLFFYEDNYGGHYNIITSTAPFSIAADDASGAVGNVVYRTVLLAPGA